MLGIYVRTSMEDRDNSIESQKKAGVEFAKKNNFEFDIYADEGKSGYKIADADENDDMFKNRPSFTRLLNDIKEKKIDAIWVLNHSRLSRNQYGSAYIFRKLEKQKIKVYMGDTLYDYKNKESKFQRAIMDAFDEYDRERIVINTTRGLHFKIDKGERTFGKLYGYKRIGTTEKGLQKIKPVGSEIENIKYGYKRILEGATLRQLTLELYNKKSLDKTESMRISLKWHKILCHFSYTGYELNLKGLAVLKEFNNFEIDTVSMLNDTKYYTRSSNYKEKIISVENWIKTVERLHINRQVRLQYRTNKASKDMATGIIKCSECGQKYYSYIHDNKKGGKLYRYNYYKHYMAMNRKIHDCHQKKSFVSYNINEMLKIFYFFNYIMFDKTEERNKETLHLIKQEQAKMKEEIGKTEKEITQYEKNIRKFNRALDETDEVETIKVLAKRISGDEEKKTKANEGLAGLQIELEKLNIKYAGTELENMYYNVKDRINGFFKKLNTEEQRNELVKTIKECVVTGTHIIIDSGANIFIFDTENTYEFDKSLLKKLDDDKYFKISYLGQNKNIDIKALMKGDKELVKDIITADDNIRDFGKVMMRPVYLGNKEYDMKGYVRDIFRENYIDYSLEGKLNAVFFYVKE